MAVQAVSPAAAGVKVGSVFYSSWGYDQTNVNFYRVVGLTAKGVKVQEVHGQVVGESGGPSERVVPSETVKVGGWVKVPGGWTEYDKEASPVITKRLQSYDGGKSVFITISDCQTGYLHQEGTSHHQTGWGFGH